MAPRLCVSTQCPLYYPILRSGYCFFDVLYRTDDRWKYAENEKTARNEHDCT